MMDNYSSETSSNVFIDPKALMADDSYLTEIKEVHRETNDHKSINIIHLPEVALIDVVGFLTLSERYYLSLTCHRFHKLFSHPRFWAVSNIKIDTSDHHSGTIVRWNGMILSQETLALIFKRYSQHFQNLAFEMSNFQALDDTCRMLLQDLNTDCRLKCITLKLGSVRTNNTQSQQISSQQSNDLALIESLIYNSTRLQHINIISWPVESGIVEELGKCPLFSALLSNTKLSQLKSLNLYYADHKMGPWTPFIPRLPSTASTLTLVSHFKYLKCLSLRSPMLSDELLREIVSEKRSRLEALKILIMPSNHPNNHRTPDISPGTWSAVTLSSPQLKVEYLISTRIPFEHLRKMLTPDIPLASVIILNYGKCDKELIEIMPEYYSATLENFTSLCDSPENDEALIKVVTTCPQLKSLCYYGEISYLSIIEMARIISLQGRKFDCFKFNPKNVRTNLDPGENDETVIKKNGSSEEYDLVAVRQWHRDEDDHQKKLDIMAESVSRALGYHWYLEK